MVERRVKRGIVIAAAAAATSVVMSISCGILSFGRFPWTPSFSRVAEGSPPPLPAHFPDVAIVSLDEQSLQSSEQPWPWPRGRFAEIVYRLEAAGAEVLAFSFDFSERRERRNDMAFARAIKQSRRVVLAAHRESRDGEGERVRLPAPEFWIGAAAIGHLLYDVDRDGIVRHGMRDHRIAAHALPSLSQAAVALALGQDPVPSDTRRFAIDYRWANTPIPSIPMDDVIQGRFDPGAVAGRIVFIGGTASRFQDMWTTPLGPNQPGLYIQALAARTLLAEYAAASQQTWR